ncbi:hypothetical protein BU16DRAFT_614610 [Lophium mytilinum]|uniref:VOC domain-containing protein n=1 Tax=Lophium mytilinum TaxID=390894 RepID=A0A6A6R326_9PEZI|nr:hypothetical protein BU16DRAFT_614610 [Lophium mytilinum]
MSQHRPHPEGTPDSNPHPLTHTPTPLAAPFLGNLIEICIVTPSATRTMDGLLALGIGPFRVFNFTPASVSNQTIHGAPAPFALRVCFATQGSLTWEIMEPVSGPSLMAEFVAAKGEGVHHVAFDCAEGRERTVEERVAEFERRGFACVMSGDWRGERGVCRFRFFDTEGSAATCFETYEFSEDWVEPGDVEVYPPLEGV